MRMGTVTQTGIGQSQPLPVDYVQVPSVIELFANTLAAGYAQYTIQYTTDDIQATDYNGNPVYNPATGNWFDVPGLTTVSGDNALSWTQLVTAFRINLLNGNGTVQLQARQGIGQ